jgi:hypothetical protein
MGVGSIVDHSKSREAAFIWMGASQDRGRRVDGVVNCVSNDHDGANGAQCEKRSYQGGTDDDQSPPRGS